MGYVQYKQQIKQTKIHQETLEEQKRQSEIMDRWVKIIEKQTEQNAETAKKQ